MNGIWKQIIQKDRKEDRKTDIFEDSRKEGRKNNFQNVLLLLLI